MDDLQVFPKLARRENDVLVLLGKLWALTCSFRLSDRQSISQEKSD